VQLPALRRAPMPGEPVRSPRRSDRPLPWRRAVRPRPVPDRGGRAALSLVDSLWLPCQSGTVCRYGSGAGLSALVTRLDAYCRASSRRRTTKTPNPVPAARARRSHHARLPTVRALTCAD